MFKCALYLLLTVALLAAGVTSVAASQATTIASILEAQEKHKLTNGIWRAEYRLETHGPCAAFVNSLPRGVTGEQFRQVEYQTWAARGDGRSVTLSSQTEVWVDDELVHNLEDNLPIRVNGTNGVEAFRITYPAQDIVLLSVGAQWPYAGAEQPIMFGRGTGSFYFSDLLSGAGTTNPEEQPDGRFMVTHRTQGGFTVEMLFDPRLAWMCVEETGRTDNGVVYERHFYFEEQNGEVQPFPIRATQTYFYPKGYVAEHEWTLLSWSREDNSSVDPFSPNLDSFQFVKDERTTTFLKGSREALSAAVAQESATP